MGNCKTSRARTSLPCRELAGQPADGQRHGWPRHRRRGNIASIAEAATTRTFTYDELERLTAVNDTGGATLESYSLDEEGNRIASHLATFHVTEALSH